MLCCYVRKMADYFMLVYYMYIEDRAVTEWTLENVFFFYFKKLIKITTLLRTWIHARL